MDSDGIDMSAPASDQLLSASENHAIQSFLSSIDLGDGIAPPQDWSLLATGLEDRLPYARGRESLAAATKSLMSLEMPRQHQHAPRPMHPLPQHFHSQQQHHSPPFTANSHLGNSAYFNTSSASFHPPPDVKPQPFGALGGDIMSGSPLAINPSHTQASVFDFPSHPPPTSIVISPAPSPSALPEKRPSAENASHPAKRPRPSKMKSSNSRTSGSGSTPPPSISASTSTLLPSSSRPALLSASQKKANHIQSEQKRRANIRKGYDALCDCVPELREAIRREEETMYTAAEVDTAKGKPRRRRGKNDEGEKVDGRAGPRSENIVLAKTIDYIQALLHDQGILVARLQRARAVLGPNHPLAHPRSTDSLNATIPLWEREWTGGTGLDPNAEHNDSDGGSGDEDTS